jgi:hypothetical protein
MQEWPFHIITAEEGFSPEISTSFYPDTSTTNKVRLFVA